MLRSSFIFPFLLKKNCPRKPQQTQIFAMMAFYLGLIILVFVRIQGKNVLPMKFGSGSWNKSSKLVVAV
ncbi:MAG: hypothetical protein ACQCN4_09025, partial [Candidatus Bathyarchaeia archaeon]|jgi:hypothetical protein